MASSDFIGNTSQNSNGQHDKNTFFVDPSAALELWEKFAKDLGRELTIDEKAAADMGIPPKGSMPEYSVKIDSPEKSVYDQNVELKHDEKSPSKNSPDVKGGTPELKTVSSQNQQTQQAKTSMVSSGNNTTLGNTEGNPRGMDEDSNYKQIKEFLRTKWLKENDEKDFDNEKGREFLASLEIEAEKLFRNKFPEQAKKYDQMEKTRIYQDPNLDPVLKNLETRGKELVRAEIEVRMSKGVNPSLAELQEIESKSVQFALEDFITSYPDKAAEYAKIKPEIKDAIEAKKKREEEKKKLVGTNNEEIGKTQNEQNQQKQKEYSGPPRGMNEDSGYQRIVNQLIKEGVVKDKIDLLAVSKFKEQNPDLYEKYQEMEKTRIYDDPQEDPAIQDLQARIGDKIHVKNELRKGIEAKPGEEQEIRDEVHSEEYSKFIRDFPEKAHGYASSSYPKRSLTMAEAIKRLEEVAETNKTLNSQPQTISVTNEKNEPEEQEAEDQLTVEKAQETDVPFKAFKDKEYQKIFARLLASVVLETQEKGASDISDEKIEETERLALSHYYKKIAEKEIEEGVSSQDFSKDELFDELLGQAVVSFEKEGKTLDNKELFKKALTDYLLKNDLRSGKS